MTRITLLALFCVGASGGLVHAQQGTTQPVALQEEPTPPQLPRVEVTPEADSAEAQEAGPLESPSSSFPSETFNFNELFPSLTDQVAQPWDGGSRGAPLSVFDNPRAIDIISQQRLIEKAPLDMGQALENEVGVMMQRTGRGQSSPYIRGLTGQQVLILVDGVRMTNSTFRSGPNQYFNTIDPNTVDHIEVIRGPGSVLYGGDAIGGVINVVTKSANYTGLNYTTGGTIQRFSSADLGYTGRVSVEGYTESTGFYGGGTYGNYNNLDIGGSPDAPVGFDVGRQPATSWRYNAADLKVTYLVDDSSELIFGLQHYRGEDIFRTDRYPSNRESIFDPQVRDLYYIRYQGVSDVGLADFYQITTSYHRTDELRKDRDYRMSANPNIVSERSFFDEQFGLTFSFMKDCDSLGTVSYGFDWYHDEIGSARTDFNYGTDPPAITDRAGEIPDDAFYSRYGAYVQWDFWMTDRLLLSSGVRYEHVAAGATVTANSVTDHIDPEYQDWIGNIGLTYELTDELHLVGSISEGFRAPNLDDLATINGNVFVGTQLPNPDLQPETSITYEVGTKLNTERFRAQTFVWWNDLQNFIDTSAPNTMLLLDRTNSQAYLNGVEFSAEYQLSYEWSVYGNYWYTYGRNVDTGQPLSRIPPQQGTLGLRKRWNDGRDWFDTYAWIVDKQDRLNDRDISDTNRIPPGGTPGYTTLNFRYGRMISPRQRLSLNVENIFDEQYRVHGSGSDGPGINALLTYELTH
ncbi:hypothetical protein C5Y96_06320 [Blastopirellula marina]|uniref:TonB-dependent receptor n=1 Tax=Blastopirellula marina TaxID=124 RepID=A0A2S8FX84_9BACT|nr:MULTISPECIES: TonB-dependent receptor [Pirellulaceae]PQO36779.1 hypothetical protein C5Y96_06320 [Blastopirellula marina]RCS53494.1 TonB-dependent receptor [Bremerella cremea]